MTCQVVIRAVASTDLRRLQDVEVAAGEAFRTLGMDLVADDDPAGIEELRRYADAGRAWVALPAGEPDDVAGYLLLDVIDGAAHIGQVSVRPDLARRGIGRALIDVAAGWAAGHGFAAVTLTTYLDVPWNGPYYERLGFRHLAPGDEGPGLRRIREDERARGLDAWPRGAMRLDGEGVTGPLAGQLRR